MSEAMMRVSGETRRLLRAMAAGERLSMQKILAKAVESYWKERFFEQANQAYAAARQHPETREALEREMAEWDTVLADGLEPEDWKANKTGSAAPKRRP